MKQISNFRRQNKFPLQVTAFMLIMLTTPFLYLAATNGLEVVSFVLLAIVASGMAISLWAS
jgi:hypothetical protein